MKLIIELIKNKKEKNLRIFLEDKDYHLSNKEEKIPPLEKDSNSLSKEETSLSTP